MLGTEPGSIGLLLDIDGVLHVGDEPIPGAIEALEEIRALTTGTLLVTNTTSKPRRAIVERLLRMGFELREEDLLTPARMAVRRCQEQGHRAVMLMVPESLREDLAELTEASGSDGIDAVVLGDLGPGFNERTMNAAFRALIDGAELIALQHNRYWQSAEGLVLDVGAYSAALEYGAGVEPVIVGKPAKGFFADALGILGVDAQHALMVGDDIEADVGGALDAGIAAVLVRTGKYREDAAAASGIRPTATIDSIAELPGLLRG